MSEDRSSDATDSPLQTMTHNFSAVIRVGESLGFSVKAKFNGIDKAYFIESVADNVSVILITPSFLTCIKPSDEVLSVSLMNVSLTNISKNNTFSPISLAQFIQIEVPPGLHIRMELRRTILFSETSSPTKADSLVPDQARTDKNTRSTNNNNNNNIALPVERNSNTHTSSKSLFSSAPSSPPAIDFDIPQSPPPLPLPAPHFQTQTMASFPNELGSPCPSTTHSLQHPQTSPPPNSSSFSWTLQEAFKQSTATAPSMPMSEINPFHTHSTSHTHTPDRVLTGNSSGNFDSPLARVGVLGESGFSDLSVTPCTIPSYAYVGGAGSSRRGSAQITRDDDHDWSPDCLPDMTPISLDDSLQGTNYLSSKHTVHTTSNTNIKITIGQEDKGFKDPSVNSNDRDNESSPLMSKSPKSMSEEEAMHFILESTVPKLKYKELETKFDSLKSQHDDTMKRLRVSEATNLKMAKQVKSATTLKAQLVESEAKLSGTLDELQRYKDLVESFQKEVKSSTNQTSELERNSYLKDISDLKTQCAEQQCQLRHNAVVIQQKVVELEDLKATNEALDIELTALLGMKDRSVGNLAHSTNELIERCETLARELSVKGSQLQDAMREVHRLRNINVYLRHGKVSNSSRIGTHKSIGSKDGVGNVSGGGSVSDKKDDDDDDGEDIVIRLMKLEEENLSLKRDLLTKQMQVDDIIANFSTSTMNFEEKVREQETKLLQKTNETERISRLFCSLLAPGGDAVLSLSSLSKTAQTGINEYPNCYVPDIDTVAESVADESLLRFGQLVGDGVSFSAHSMHSARTEWASVASATGFGDSMHKNSPVEHGLIPRSIAMPQVGDKKCVDKAIVDNMPSSGGGDKVVECVPSVKLLSGVGASAAVVNASGEDSTRMISSTWESQTELPLQTDDTAKRSATSVTTASGEFQRTVYELESELSVTKGKLNDVIEELNMTRQDYRVTMTAISETLMDDRRSSEEMLRSKTKQIEEHYQDIIQLKMQIDNLTRKNKELASFAGTMYEYQRELALYEGQLQTLKTQYDAQLSVIEQSINENNELKASLASTASELDKTKVELNEKNNAIGEMEAGFFTRYSELNASMVTHQDRFRMLAEVTKDAQQAKGEAEEKVRIVEAENRRLLEELSALNDSTSMLNLASAPETGGDDTIPKKGTSSQAKVHAKLPSQGPLSNAVSSYVPKDSTFISMLFQSDKLAYFKNNFHSASLELDADKQVDNEFHKSSSDPKDLGDAMQEQQITDQRSSRLDEELLRLKQTCTLQEDQLAHLRQRNAAMEEQLMLMKRQGVDEKDLRLSLGITPSTSNQSTDVKDTDESTATSSLLNRHTYNNNSMMMTIMPTIPLVVSPNVNTHNYEIHSENTKKTIKTMHDVVREEQDARKFLEERVAVLSSANAQLTAQLEKASDWTQPNHDKMKRLEKQLTELGSKLATEIAEKASITMKSEEQLAQVTSVVAQMDKMLMKSEELLRKEVGLRLDAEAKVQYLCKQSEVDRVLWEEKLRKIVWEMDGGLTGEETFSIPSFDVGHAPLKEEDSARITRKSDTMQYGPTSSSVVPTSMTALASAALASSSSSSSSGAMLGSMVDVDRLFKSSSVDPNLKTPFCNANSATPNQRSVNMYPMDLFKSNSGPASFGISNSSATEARLWTDSRSIEYESTDPRRSSSSTLTTADIAVPSYRLSLSSGISGSSSYSSSNNNNSNISGNNSNNNKNSNNMRWCTDPGTMDTESSELFFS